MQLQSLLAALEEQPIQQWPASGEFNLAQEITSLAYDSRKVTPGALFIAVPGAHTDGRAYLAEAAQRGALVAIGPTLDGLLPPNQATPLPYIEVRDVLGTLANLACAFYAYPAQRLCTIGVTGTDGKTTTGNLIHTILREGTSAERQLRVFRETGDLKAVVRNIVAETREGLPMQASSAAGAPSAP